MRNITLAVKNVKHPSTIDIISYTNVEDGYPNEGFFVVFVKDKKVDTRNIDSNDKHYYPSHLILKIESEFTKQYCNDSMKIEKRSISIDEFVICENTPKNS